MNTLQTTSSQILFDPFQIEDRVFEIAQELETLYGDPLSSEDVLFCPILQGAVPFFADICKNITFDPSVDYIGLSSYKGMEQQKEFSVYKVFVADLVKGKTVWLFDDIADSGTTLGFLKNLALSMGAKEVKTCTLLKKKSCPYPVDLYGFEVEDNEWVWGYGMDLDKGKGRTTNTIFSLTKEK